MVSIRVNTFSLALESGETHSTDGQEQSLIGKDIQDLIHSHVVITSLAIYVCIDACTILCYNLCILCFGYKTLCNTLLFNMEQCEHCCVNLSSFLFTLAERCPCEDPQTTEGEKK